METPFMHREYYLYIVATTGSTCAERQFLGTATSHSTISPATS